MDGAWALVLTHRTLIDSAARQAYRAAYPLAMGRDDWRQEALLIAHHAAETWNPAQGPIEPRLVACVRRAIRWVNARWREGPVWAERDGGPRRLDRIAGTTLDPEAVACARPCGPPVCASEVDTRQRFLPYPIEILTDSTVEVYAPAARREDPEPDQVAVGWE